MNIKVINTKTEKMNWKLLQGAFLLLCHLMAVVDAEEKILETQVIRHQVRVPPQVLSYQAASINNDSASGSLQARVSLPSMSCNHEHDCSEYGDLICSEGQCSCRPPACWVYEYVVTGFFTAKYVFSCGQCGVLGSSCNDTSECDYPGECWNDGYCHCKSGENYDGVCVTSDLGWSSTLTKAAVGIVILFAICIVAVNCFREPPWRNPDAWRCRCFGGGGTHRRRGSCEKSPAFTIQAHYASQDLVARPDDLEEVASVSLGGAVPRRHRSRSSQNSDTVSSISSALTNLTTVSDAASRETTDRTSPSPPPPPPPPLSLPPPNYLNSCEETNGGYGTHVFGIQLKDIPPEASASASASNTSSENPEPASVSAFGSCTHEQCQLCLPRSLSSQPSAGATRKPRSNKADYPLLSLLGSPHAGDDVQFTQL